MDISSLIPMVGDGPNRFLIESIGRINSQVLSIQQRDFHAALGGEGDSEIVCFYEVFESPTAQEVRFAYYAFNRHPLMRNRVKLATGR